MSRLPNITAKVMARALKRDGFVEHHQKGSHLYFRHAEKRLMTGVPMHPGDLRRSLMKEIIKQAGLSEAEFSKLL
mgnify:CR=1 FL=1